MKLPYLDIHDYSYSLPEDRIARYPAEQRDHSKLLVYRQGKFAHHAFYELPDLLPDNSVLFFNDTKVIPARILFEKNTGAVIEVFLLDPVLPSHQIATALTAKEKSRWHCTIGNLKRWPDGVVLSRVSQGMNIQARLINRESGLVEFSWTPKEMSFGEIVHNIGAVPLPPYIKRKPDPSDTERYQTVYSHHDGAVAAPTAGLHFTDDVISKIKARGIITDFLTLHVGAGTFLPVKSINALDHHMHEEQIILNRQNLQNILRGGLVVAVGTTALRALESAYWFGVLLLKNDKAIFEIDPFLPYEYEGDLPDTFSSINAVLKYMESIDIEILTGKTSIYIFPGYHFRICKGLITNFHQPGSTLLLLIAAWLGKTWKLAYQEALDHDYRFLSFGDSSLLLR